MTSIHRQQQVILTLDQGTTSTRSILFNSGFEPVFTAQSEYPQIYPAKGWVEHDPQDIWETTVEVIEKALAFARENKFSVAGMGIVNQRETTLIWDRATGEPIYNAIVWQDRRTAAYCQQFKSKEQWLQAKTGLRFDPYFSASKIVWLLENVEEAKKKAENGELAFGTVDTYLIWRLTNKTHHLTDTTNASRTNLLNIHTQHWDRDLLEFFDIPLALLPEINNCADEFGTTTHPAISADIPICGVAGDQQAALIGQGCLTPGETKATFGTGCFLLVNTGDEAILSSHNLLTTIAYTIDDETCYAIEGSIFVAGAAVQWLRDSMEILQNAQQSEQLASAAPEDHGLTLVPAFTGLGAPYWQPDARGALFGLTRNSTSADLVRATLESVCHQTGDLIDAIKSDGIPATRLKVDGGMVANSWFCQSLADTLDIPVTRPKVQETTALGAAYLAALQLGWFRNLDEMAKINVAQAEFDSAIAAPVRDKRKKQWKAAIEATLLMTRLSGY